jgi:hypothetical protein
MLPQKMAGLGIEDANVKLIPLHLDQASDPARRQGPTGETNEVRGGGSCRGRVEQNRGPASGAHRPLYRVRIPPEAAIAFPTRPLSCPSLQHRLVLGLGAETRRLHNLLANGGSLQQRKTPFDVARNRYHPSLHTSGLRYRWHSAEVEIEDAPAWLKKSSLPIGSVSPRKHCSVDIRG